MKKVSDAMIEGSAFAIYCEFIRHGAGSLMWRRDENGMILKGSDGSPIKETYQQACLRRWRAVPDKVRQDFMREAEAALRAAA